MAARSISESVPVPAAAACFSLAFLVAEFSVFQFVLASLVVVFYVQLVESAFALLVGPVVGVSPPVVVAAAASLVPAVVVTGAPVAAPIAGAAPVGGTRQALDIVPDIVRIVADKSHIDIVVADVQQHMNWIHWNQF